MWWMAAAGLGVVGAGFGLHRLALWAEARGWIYYRTHRMPPGATGLALMEVAAMLEPGVEHVVEEQRSRRAGAEAGSSGQPCSGEPDHGDRPLIRLCLTTPGRA